MLPTSTQIHSALNTIYGAATSTDVLVIGTGNTGPVNIPVTVSSYADAAEIFGDTVTEMRTLPYGATTLTLSAAPRRDTLLIRSVVNNRIVPDVLHQLSWDGAVATFLPVRHIGQHERRTFLITYAPQHRATDVMSAMEDLDSVGPVTLMQAGGSHAVAVIPTHNYTITATISTGSAIMTVTSGLGNLSVGMVCILQGTTRPLTITDITGSDVTVDADFTVPDGSYTLFAGGALLLVTKYSGVAGIGFSARIYTMVGSTEKLLELVPPPTFGQGPLTFRITTGATLLDVVNEINGRAIMGQTALCATAVAPHLEAVFMSQEYQLTGATTYNTDDDWPQAVANSLDSVNFSAYQVITIPL